jgi:hypothetical protein
MRAFTYDPDMESDDERADVVDLLPYVAPIQRLVTWYDRLADPAVDEPDIFQLDDIVRSLQALPPLTGQLGRDLKLVAYAADDAIRADIIDAIGRLRRVSTFGQHEAP